MTTALTTPPATTSTQSSPGNGATGTEKPAIEVPKVDAKTDQKTAAAGAKPEGSAGDAGKQSDEKAAEGDKTTAVEDVVLKFAEGVKVDAALVGKVTPLFKEFGLKSEQAQKLADAFVKHQAEALAAQAKADDEAIAQVQKGYETALKADKELGGAHFNASIAAGQKALAKYGSPELTGFLDRTGLGNHPEIVRFFAKVGKAMGEDSTRNATGGASETPDPRAVLLERYPTMKPKSA